jgi:hypothetical protein
MVRPNITSRRRMKLEDIIRKLAQIEEQAASTLHEYPHGLTVERQRLILGLARQMRAHIEDQLRGGERLPSVNDDEAHHLHSVPASEKSVAAAK